MQKYIIRLVKSDECTVLAMFDTKEEALAAGPAFRKEYTREQGLISCIRANVDENGTIDFRVYTFYEAWC